MRVTSEQLLDLLAAGAPEGSVWVYHEDKSTEIIEDPSRELLEAVQARDQWPMYLVRVDMAENYIRDHGLDGALQLLNLTFSLIPEPRSMVARAAAITGRFLKRKSLPAQEV